MVHQKIDGFAVIQRNFLGKGYKVVGIGQDTCEAIQDANQRLTNSRFATRDFMRNNDECKLVKAKITVSYEKPEAVK
ncbi:MAG: hypothetical protein Q8J66_09300 [Methylotenera sp.]|nr:hypothetical protein [Methylotenera sp.]